MLLRKPEGAHEEGFHPGCLRGRWLSLKFSQLRQRPPPPFALLRSGFSSAALPPTAAETGLAGPRRSAPQGPDESLPASGPLVAARSGGEALGAHLRVGVIGGPARRGGVGRLAADLLDALQYPMAAGSGHRGVAPQVHGPVGIASWGCADLAGPEPQFRFHSAGLGSRKGHIVSGCPAGSAAPQPRSKHRCHWRRHRPFHPAQRTKALQQQSHGHRHGC